jgi:hypothetical protein
MKTFTCYPRLLMKSIIGFSFFIFSFSFSQAQKIAGPPPLIAVTNLIDSNVACNLSFAERWGGAFYFKWSDATPLATSYTIGVGSPDWGRVYYNVTSYDTGTVAVPSYSGYVGPGTYRIFIEDNEGNSSSSNTFTITQPAAWLVEGPVTYTDVTCSSLGNASVSPTGGTPPYSFVWSNGTSTVSTTNPMGDIFSAGTYTAVTIDAHGCSSGDQSFTITNTSTVHPWWWNVTNVTCYGAGNGVATTSVYGGAEPYTYAWSSTPTTTIITDANHGAAINLAPGYTYTITVTDATGCIAGISTTVTQPASALTQSPITLNSEPTCHGYKNGIATAGTGSGGTPFTSGPAYKFVWSDGETTQQAAALDATTVSCQIVDANKCTAMQTIVIPQPAPITGTFPSKVEPLCNDNTNGSMTVVPSGGTGTYTYAWAPSGETTATANNLSATTYTVTIHDKNGCSGTATGALAQPNALTNTVTASVCKNGKSTLSVHPVGGTSPYTYAWSTTSTLSAIIESPGTYSVSVTDNNHCTVGTPFTFTVCPVSEIRNRDGSDDGEDDASVNGSADINVYPNPTNGQFTIAGLEQGQIMEMYDYTGRKISTVSASDMTLQLNLSTQPNGIYLIRILDKDGNLVGMKKVVKTN